MLGRKSIVFLCVSILILVTEDISFASYSYDADVSHIAKAIYTLIGCMVLVAIGTGAYLTEGSAARRTLLVITVLFTFLGGMTVFSGSHDSNNDNNIIAIFLSLPALGFIGTFIATANIFSSMPKFKAGLFSGVSGPLIYMITHAFVGFGVTEASLSAISTAVILGALGYSSD